MVEHYFPRTKKGKPLLKKLREVLAVEEIEESHFKELQEQVFKLFGVPGEDDISNLALLERGDNSALSNSIFPAKRRKIMELEGQGRFIPPATRAVFAKYFTPYPKELHIWNMEDREGYRKALEGRLKDFLKGEE
ncbi:MAG: hypothetical protein GXO38_03045 [Epsilonproteobacteria bacterium]|nr:hypothetical protein [Campylobacterota bacterium]